MREIGKLRQLQKELILARNLAWKHPEIQAAIDAALKLVDRAITEETPEVEEQETAPPARASWR
jgi:hypothetical protein